MGNYCNTLVITTQIKTTSLLRALGVPPYITTQHSLPPPEMTVVLPFRVVTSWSFCGLPLWCVHTGSCLLCLNVAAHTLPAFPGLTVAPLMDLWAISEQPSAVEHAPVYPQAGGGVQGLGHTHGKPGGGARSPGGT